MAIGINYLLVELRRRKWSDQSAQQILIISLKKLGLLKSTEMNLRMSSPKAMGYQKFSVSDLRSSIFE